MKLFFLVLARDEKHVDDKVEELQALGIPFLVICGKKLHHPNVIYRAPRGKWDAINFGFEFVPKNTDIVALNDVDTRIVNFDSSLKPLEHEDVALVFARVTVETGPQKLFYGFLDSIRKRVLITASGELMLIRYEVLKRIVPIKPCKAEDSYILFKALELKYKAILSEDCSVLTERTKTAEKEEIYKRKTVSGIYQAISYTNPPSTVRLFYALFPFACPLLIVSGKKGYYWMKGVLLGLLDYLRHDRSGLWQTTYME